MPGSIHFMPPSPPSGIDPAMHQLILAAIRNKRLLRFLYHGKLRVVEPQDYGMQKNTVHLFTYQTGGQSSSGPIPEWRKFAVAAISKLELLEQTFPGSRAVPEHRHQTWDVLFARVNQ